MACLLLSLLYANIFICICLLYFQTTIMSTMSQTWALHTTWLPHPHRSRDFPGHVAMESSNHGVMRVVPQTDLRGVVLQSGATGMAIAAPEPYTQALQHGRLIWNGDKVAPGYKGIRINVLCPPGRSKEEVERLLRGPPRLNSAPVRSARQRARILGSVKSDAPPSQPQGKTTMRTTSKRVDAEALSGLLYPKKRYVTLSGRREVDYVTILSGQNRGESGIEGRGRVVKLYMQSGIPRQGSSMKTSDVRSSEVEEETSQTESGDSDGLSGGNPNSGLNPVTWRQGRSNTIVSISNSIRHGGVEDKDHAVKSRSNSDGSPRDRRLLRKPLSAGNEATLSMRSGKPPDGVSRRPSGRRETPHGGASRQTLSTDQLKNATNGRQKTSDLSISPYFNVSVDSNSMTYVSREQAQLNAHKILVLRNAEIHPRMRTSHVSNHVKDPPPGRRSKRVVRFNSAAEVHEYDRFSPLHHYR